MQLDITYEVDEELQESLYLLLGCKCIKSIYLLVTIRVSPYVPATLDSIEEKFSISIEHVEPRAVNCIYCDKYILNYKREQVANLLDEKILQSLVDKSYYILLEKDLQSLAEWKYENLRNDV